MADAFALAIDSEKIFFIFAFVVACGPLQMRFHE